MENTYAQRSPRNRMASVDIPHYKEDPDDDWIEETQRKPEPPAPPAAETLPQSAVDDVPQKEETFSEDEVQWVLPQQRWKAQEVPTAAQHSGTFYDDAAHDAAVRQNDFVPPVPTELPHSQTESEVFAAPVPPAPIPAKTPVPVPERDDLDAEEWTRMKAAGIDMMFFKEERQFDGTWCLKPLLSGKSSFILWKEKDGILRIILSPLIFGSDDPFGGTGVNIIKQFFEGANEFGGKITNMTPAMFEPVDNTNSIYRCMRRGIIIQKENEKA